MRTAICFTGICRSLEYTHENIRENLIKAVGDCDVFMYIADGPTAYKAEKYFNASEITELKVEKETPIDASGISFEPNWPPHGSKQVYLQMLYSMKRCNEMRVEHELKNNIKYDRIIRSRLDIRYFKPVDSIDEYDLQFLHVPDFHCWSIVQGNGLNDRFAVGSRRDMNIYLSEFDYIKKYSMQGLKIHAESTLCWHLANSGVTVKYCPVRFTRVRPDGNEEDKHLETGPPFPAGEGA